MGAIFCFHLFMKFLIEVFLFQKKFILYKKTEDGNCRICDICNVNVHRASYAKQLRSKKHLENKKQSETTIPEWLNKEEQAPIRKTFQKVHNPKTLTQIAKEKF